MEAQLNQLDGQDSDSDGPPSLVSSSSSDGPPPLVSFSSDDGDSDAVLDDHGGVPLQPIDHGGVPLQPIEMPDCVPLRSFMMELAHAMVRKMDGDDCDNKAVHSSLLRVASEMANLHADYVLRALVQSRRTFHRVVLVTTIFQPVDDSAHRRHAPEPPGLTGKAMGKGKATGKRRGKGTSTAYVQEDPIQSARNAIWASDRREH